MTSPSDLDLAELERTICEEWCEQEGCRVQSMGQRPTSATFTCETCLAIWSVRQTAVGLVWWRSGTMAPSSEVRQ